MPSRRRAVAFSMLICLSLTTGAAAVTQTTDDPARLGAEQDEPFNVTAIDRWAVISAGSNLGAEAVLIVEGAERVTVSSPAANASVLAGLFSNGSVVGEHVRVTVPPDDRIILNVSTLEECLVGDVPLRIEDPATGANRIVEINIVTEPESRFKSSVPTVYQGGSVAVTFRAAPCHETDRMRFQFWGERRSGEGDRLRGAVTVIDRHEDGAVDRLHVRVNTSRSDAGLFEPAGGDAIVNATVTDTSGGSLPPGRYRFNRTSDSWTRGDFQVLAPLNGDLPTTTVTPTPTTTATPTTTTTATPETTTTTTTTPTTTEPTPTTTSASPTTTTPTQSTTTTTASTTTTTSLPPTTTTPAGQSGFTLALALLAVVGVVGLAVRRR